MASGTIKWFNNLKGYGFISPDEEGADIFIHHSLLTPDERKILTEGQSVHFTTSDGPKGPEALNITIIYDNDKADD